MTWLVQARLINEPFADPGLYLDFRFERRALLFDLGDLSAVSSRELLRVSDVFVSHTHMDHFAGFDRLLRLCLHRTAPLRLVGPPGFGDRVAAKLGGYTWNLLDETSVDFVMLVDEFDARVQRRFRFAARDAFVRQELDPPELREGYALVEEQFTVEAVTFDHGTPCLGFALQERLNVNVVKEGLTALGLPVGPWLTTAKRAVRRGDQDDSEIAIDAAQSVRLGRLKERALRIMPGQRIAYLVDMCGHEENVSRAVRLAQGAHQLFIEAAFAEEDAALAIQRCHLTATRAGEIARHAGVRQVIPFHFSPRYLDRPQHLVEQVERAFGAAPAQLRVSEAG